MHRLIRGVLAALLLVALSAVSVVAGETTPTPTAIATPSPDGDAGIVLLTEDQVPEGLVLIDDGERTLEDVAGGFDDPEEAIERFTGWGWERNLIRAFHLPDDAPARPGEIDGIYLSVHEFDGPDSAADALDYALDAQATAADLREIEIPALGDSSRGLFGEPSYGNEVTLYVQQGNALIRLSVASPEGDPTEEAIELMRVMLASQTATPVAG